MKVEWFTLFSLKVFEQCNLKFLSWCSVQIYVSQGKDVRVYEPPRIYLFFLFCNKN